MKVYHGSNMIVDKPDVRRSKHIRDMIRLHSLIRML